MSIPAGGLRLGVRLGLHTHSSAHFEIVAGSGGGGGGGGGDGDVGRRGAVFNLLQVRAASWIRYH